MRLKDLAVGDRVWVVVPNSGGRGWAEILDLDATHLQNHHRKSYTIHVRFERGASARNYLNGGVLVPAAAIVRKATADDPLPEGAAVEKVAREFTVGWLNEQGEEYASTPFGATCEISADDFADAMWQATRLLREKIRSERRAVEQGLYGRGFVIREVTG